MDYISEENNKMEYYSLMDIFYEKKNNNWKWTEHIVPIIENPSQFQYLSNSLKVKGLCIIAVMNDGLNIQYVPANIIDADICEVAITNNPESHKFIPIHFLTASICFQIIKNDWIYAASIAFKKLSIHVQNELLDLILTYDGINEKETILNWTKNDKVNCINLLIRKIDNINYLDEIVLIKLIQLGFTNKLSKARLFFLKNKTDFFNQLSKERMA